MQLWKMFNSMRRMKTNDAFSSILYLCDMRTKLTKLFSVRFLTLAFMGVALCLSVARAQTIIYSDTFSRTGTLTGSAPEIASGLDGGSATATWTANSAWTTNGSVASTTAASAATAYLPFTPTLGVTYNLSLNLTSTADSNAWVAMGFQTNPIPTAGGSQATAFQQPVSGPDGQDGPGAIMWDLLTPNGTVQGFGGPSTNDFVLNTSGAQGALYSITFDETSAGNYTFSYAVGAVTSATFNITGAPQITAVSFGEPQGTITDSVDNFTLSDNNATTVPEPSTYAMLLSGALVLGLVMRRRSKA